MADGYKEITEFSDVTQGDIKQGYCSRGELDLADIFAPFDMPNYGLPGGACTIDDYSPEGVMDAPYSRKQTAVSELDDEEAEAKEGKATPARRMSGRYP